MMRYSPTIWFWNFIGFALIVVSFGVSWSLIRSSNYRLEAANQKIEVNLAVDKVKQVSSELEHRVKTLPLSDPAKRQITRDLNRVDNQLNEVNESILSDTQPK